MHAWPSSSDKDSGGLEEGDGYGCTPLNAKVQTSFIDTTTMRIATVNTVERRTRSDRQYTIDNNTETMCCEELQRAMRAERRTGVEKHLTIAC